jgi:primosomal protein N' (replication factor Y) (superfamily II helicase)
VDDPAQPDQLALVQRPPTRRRTRETDPITKDRPIARVLVDIPLAHLDRPFDYLVPVSMAGAAVSGARVAVRFAGQDVDGFLLERTAESTHEGRLARLRTVRSPEPVLAPQIATLARAVADRYAGTVADVLRLAIPPRHAAVEQEHTRAQTLSPPAAPGPAGWGEHVDGAALLAALSSRGTPRAVWNPGPAADWPDLLARLLATTLSAGRGAIAVVPDARDLASADRALDRTIGPGHHVVLSADLGPAERYRRWLAVRRGAARAVLGTRAAMFAPVEGLGLVVVWDDGDDLHAEPRAPYPHVREVLLLRALQEGAGAVIGGFARTAEAEQLVDSGWARPVVPGRDTIRRRTPRVSAAGADHELAQDEGARTARLPSVAWRAARAGLQRGPVLVQVPRTGYIPALLCARCRSAARCNACHGPLGLGPGGGPPICGWCATAATGWTCSNCRATSVRAAVVGAGRTAEELGRAFPGVPVRISGRGAVLPDVPGDPALVVATPGAEPHAIGGYAAALLLDGDALLARPGLRATEEAFRRWLRAAALVRTGPAGGAVVVVAPAAAPAVQALVRWDPAGLAARELSDRATSGFPPVARAIELTGATADVTELLGLTDLPEEAQILGPVPARTEGHQQVILRAPRPAASKLTAAVKAAQGIRAARRSGGPVRVRVDPVDLG